MQESCLIIPCYNEANRLAVNIYEDFISSNSSIDFVFVNDGSSDDTNQILDDLQSNFKNVFSIDLVHNVGKGEAIRLAMLNVASKGYSKIGFWDADLSTPLTEVVKFISCINDFHEIVIGSRIKRMGAVVERSYIRHVFGRVFATFASNILELPIYDTQCGAKFFKGELVPIIFSKPFMSKWIFDVELIQRYKKYCLAEGRELRIYELPLSRWIDNGDSKLKLSDFLKVPFELLRIFLLK